MATRLPAIETVTRLLVTAISLPFLDKVGRRKFQLLSITGLIFCNTTLAFLLSDVATDEQSCYGVQFGKAGNYAALIVIYLQSISVSPGVNVIAWMITPELFRTNARLKAAFLVSTVYWVTNFLVSIGFNLIQNIICGWVFLVFATCQVFFFIYFWFEFPVLDGKSVNEIAAMFEKEAESASNFDNREMIEQSRDQSLSLLD